MGRNMLHDEHSGVVEDIEDSGLELGCCNAKGLGRLVGVMVGRADRRTEGVGAGRDAGDDGSHHRAGDAVAGRDVRIDGT